MEKNRCYVVRPSTVWTNTGEIVVGHSGPSSLLIVSDGVKVFSDAGALGSTLDSAFDGVVAWPANYTDFMLEAVPALPASNNWSAVTNPPFVSGTVNFVTNAATEPQTFYRLVQP